jgi:hypothetical protein
VQLDDATLRAKLAAAHAYLELRDEVQAAVASRGDEHFRIECLKRVTNARPDVPEKPFYELCGEKRVAQGEYDSVIRYHEHILPLQQAIDRHVAATARPLVKVQVAS